MFNSLKVLLVLSVLITFVQSCNKGPLSGDMVSNMEKLDKLYGPCDNPHRKIVGAKQRMLCEDKQRAAGPSGKIPDPISLTDFSKNFNNAKSGVYQGMSVNSHLWQASLNILDQYPLKIVDSQGGFISTEWIMENTSPNQRCNIKVTVKSTELVSNGVKVKLICQQKTDGSWYNDNTEYSKEEKDLTLKILETAIQIKVEDQL